MDAHEILKGARALISKPENWCIGLRERRNGKQVQYCALGAMSKVLYDDAWSFQQTPEHRIAERTLEGLVGSVAPYNNTHSHECVVAWFDRAIEETAK